MAVANSIMQQRPQKNPMVITFQVGEETVKLSPQIVKNYLVSGSPETVTEQEIVMFMNLCKFQHLNPFLREAYLIKYGNQPAAIVTGKSALEKRASRCGKYAGFKAGIVVINGAGEMEYREGSLSLNGEHLVGGWCDVYVEGYKIPVRAVVSIDEYIGRKKDGTVNAQWSGKPATMIRKVAKMQALREAFPEDFAGMYSAEEVAAGDYEMPNAPITPPQEAAPEPIPAEVVNEAPAPAPVDDFAAIMEG